MTTPVRPFDSRRSLVALAALAACAPAWSQATAAANEGEIKSETETQAKVNFGLGGVSGDRADRALFGQYNGMRTGSAYGLLGFDYSQRTPATGASLKVAGTNLLLETRELGLRVARPGEWKFSADYSEGVHYDPSTVSTGLLGAGTTRPQVAVLPGGPGTGSDLDLKLKRTGVGLAFSNYISSSLQLDLSAKTEHKEGSRLSGIGFNCPSSLTPTCRGTTGTEAGWAVLMLPEPVDSSHTQLEARLSYAGEKLKVSGGYYGSFYNNLNAALNPGVPGSLNNPVGALLPLSSGLQNILSQPVALPPDNQAHQFDITGLYAFTPTTRATFKLGYTRATQSQDFTAAGLSGAPAGVTNLGGKLSTTLVQLGLNSRPTPKLSVVADLRYDNTTDQTPLALYNVEGTNTYTNMHLPQTKVRGKLLANYQFTSAYRGSAVADFETIDRGVFTPTSAVSGVSALRQKTDEAGMKLELRRSMSADFSGAVSVSSSWRNGSNWLKVNSGRGVTEVTDPSDPATGFGPDAIFMPTLANRHRDKAKLVADWQPTERLSLQFSAEAGQDRYSTPSAVGLQSSAMSLVNVDFDFALSDAWSVNGYLSRGGQRYHQVRPAGSIMSFDNTGTYAGLGVSGKASGKVRVGGGLAWVNDASVYAQGLEASANASSAALLAASGGLPDIVFRQLALNMFGTYDIDKRSSVRLNLLYQRSRWNDWAWSYNGVPFAYSDGTTLNQKPDQRVAFMGIAYSYGWP